MKSEGIQLSRNKNIIQRMPINKTVDSILIANTHLPLYNGDLARFLRYKNIKQ